MKRNPVIPYAMIAILGIGLMFVLAFVGLGQQDEVQQAHKEGGEAEQKQETVSSDPEAVFKNSCAACHGADLSGGAGPNLQEIGSKYDVAGIQDIIINGKGAAMPGGLVDAKQAKVLAE